MRPTPSSLQSVWGQIKPTTFCQLKQHQTTVYVPDYTVYRWTLTPVICGTCSMGCYHWHVWSVNIHTRYHCDLHRRSLKLLKSLKSLFTLLFALCCSNHRIWNFKRNKGYCPLSETTSTGIYWFHTQYFL